MFRFLLVVGVLLQTFAVQAEHSAVISIRNVADTTATNKIEILNLRSHHWCPICNTMVENTQLTLNTYFADEVRTGKIVFKTVDIDKLKEQEHPEELKISGVVILLRTIIKKEVKDIDLTDLVFINRDDPEKCSLQLKRKIDNELIKL